MEAVRRDRLQKEIWSPAIETIARSAPFLSDNEFAIVNAHGKDTFVGA